MDDVIARAVAVEPSLNAFALLDCEAACAAADDLDRRIAAGETPGPLAGVPFSVKDLVATRGMETAYGSHIFAGHVPQEDAEAVARLRRAGAILIGKTNTPEFGHKALTNNPRHGYTRNPWGWCPTKPPSSCFRPSSIWGSMPATQTIWPSA